MRKKRRGFLRYVVLFFALVGVGAFYVFERIRMFELVNTVERQKEERERVKDENERLRIELAQLLSREAVERFATEALHMRYPKPGEVVEALR
jgi:cell division protein FtsL